MTMHFVQRSCSSLEDHISISSMMNHHFTPCLDLDLNVQKTRRYFWQWFHIQKNKWKLKYKREKRSCGRFWRAALTGHGQSSQSADFWKIAKMALFNPCIEFKTFLGPMTSFEVLWKCHQVILSKTCFRSRVCA